MEMISLWVAIEADEKVHVGYGFASHITHSLVFKNPFFQESMQLI